MLRKNLAPILLAALVAGISSTAALALELKKGDHICIIGNTLAERMQHFGWLETRLHARFPQHELVFRNLGYSGDEIDPGKRLRSMSFGSPDEWLSASAPVPQPNKLANLDQVRQNRFELTDTKADVILAFFGYNEAQAGEAGLAQFKQQLEGQLKHMLGQKYNGEAAPRIVLFSPIAHEDLKNRNLPDGSQDNTRLKMYTAAMAEVAKANGVEFVDLFTPSAELYRTASQPLTINGIHLTEQGDKLLAAEIEKALLPAAATTVDDAAQETLRKSVLDKNFYWYNRYRTTDGYSTYGDRAFLAFTDKQTNYEVLQRELEILDQLTSHRDRHVWAVAQGSDRPIDDSGTLDYVPVVTNKPGTLDGGKHLYLSGEEAIEKMAVHPGLKIELFASEERFPELVNPVQMAFDTRGRMWVAVWPTYPHWKPRQPMNDKLLILEDTDNDGKADKCTTFADDIHNPTGFEFWGGGVILAQGPDILFLKDTDGDDKYDVKERLLHGLDTADTHHTANSFALDPGGALYFQEGTFHHTQVETPWGAPRRVANGAVFRYEPRTQKFDVYVSFGFANPHGHVFDAWGNDLVYDGTGANPFHAALFSGDVDFPQKHGRPPQVYQQRTRPCSGVEILSSSHFPEEFRGNLLVLNVIGIQGMLQYKLSDKGASFGATEVDPIVLSSDANFRPADLEVAPDGSIYFADWQNTIIGHMQHNLRDPSRDHLHGRVYRVRHSERELLKPVAIAGEPVAKLLDLLKEPDDRVRYRARIELSGRPTDEVVAAVGKWLAGLDKNDANYAHQALEGLWQYQSHNVVNEPHLAAVLRSPDFRARAAATRVLCYWRDQVADPLALLLVQVNDEHPRVRLEAIRSLSFFTGAQAEKAIEVAVESLIHEQDEFLKFQLDETNKTLDARAKAAKQLGL
ncbi:MAG: PVC-type heme-binding CxxCH protein [Pirellulales bacterium]